MNADKHVQYFEGFQIKHNADGFYWQEGGYFSTLVECCNDIADWNRVGGDDLDYDQPDSPAIPIPRWDHFS